MLFADSEPENEGNGSVEDAWDPRGRSLPKTKAKLKGKGRQVQVSHLENEMNELSIGRHPATMLPATREEHQNAQEDEDEDDSDIVPILKKKKRLVLTIARPRMLNFMRNRQLGKQQIMTEAQIEQATYALEKMTAKSDIRRLTGR